MHKDYNDIGDDFMVMRVELNSGPEQNLLIFSFGEGDEDYFYSSSVGKTEGEEYCEKMGINWQRVILGACDLILDRGFDKRMQIVTVLSKMIAENIFKNYIACFSCSISDSERCKIFNTLINNVSSKLQRGLQDYCQYLQEQHASFFQWRAQQRNVSLSPPLETKPNLMEIVNHL